MASNPERLLKAFAAIDAANSLDPKSVWWTGVAAGQSDLRPAHVGGTGTVRARRFRELQIAAAGPAHRALDHPPQSVSDGAAGLPPMAACSARPSCGAALGHSRGALLRQAAIARVASIVRKERRRKTTRCRRWRT